MSSVIYHSFLSSQLSHLYHHLSLFWEAWLHAKYRKKSNFKRFYVRLEALPANKCAKIFSGNQPYQCLVKIKNKGQNLETNNSSEECCLLGCGAV
jgi:hypothetical protein